MSFSNPEISQIMSIENNRYCVDCSAQNPLFSSINNAVFLCEGCANIHKGLGPNISVVRSLTNEQLTPEEINILKIGGNFRFKTLMNEYGISSDQNKEFKYHLKIAEYYRKLLLAELNKGNNPEEYDSLVNNKPNPETGLQLMDSVTVESIQQSQNEIIKDANNIAGKITGFLSSVGNAINDISHKYGIDQKAEDLKNKVNEAAKNFGESHPTIQNAATTAMEGIKTAGNFVVETANKVANSEPVQNVTKKVNEKVQEVVNSETVKNLSKKAEEHYINLKNMAMEKFGNNNNNNNDNNNMNNQ